jgi:DNA-binding NarL/FixJ family response regulator
MSKRNQISVLCVDDHRLVREGIGVLLNRQPDIQVVASVATGEEAIAFYKKVHPDVVLMDLRLRTISGLEAIQRLTKVDPDARIIVVTMHDGDEDVFRALNAGARAYLLKDAVPDELAQAVRAVNAGGRHVPPVIEAKLKERAGRRALTEREIEVLRLLCEGAERREISDRLTITEETVHVHLRNIYGKLRVTNRGAAVDIALRRGIIHRD